MKKVLIGLVIAVMMTGSGYADARVLFTSTMGNNLYVKTICVDGFKFVLASSDSGVSITQFMKRTGVESCRM